jgi:heme-degrading monooxygenase HmoA
MFARVVEIATKPGKSQDVANTIAEKILPFLRQQPGFLDETVLTSDMESNRVLGISFWKTKEDAERYDREHAGASFPGRESSAAKRRRRHQDSAPCVTFQSLTGSTHTVAGRRLETGF